MAFIISGDIQLVHVRIITLSIFHPNFSHTGQFYPMFYQAKIFLSLTREG